MRYHVDVNVELLLLFYRILIVIRMIKVQGDLNENVDEALSNRACVIKLHESKIMGILLSDCFKKIREV